MTQTLQKQIIMRLKQKTCEQKNCRNNNEDNIQLIVFGKQNIKRSGLMCSECFMDSQLIQQIKPLQSHSISIKKFMKTLTKKYQQYNQEKKSVNWGPDILDNKRSEIRQLLNSYEQTLFTGTKQIVKFIEEMQIKTLQQIKLLHKDISFQKLAELLAEQDQQEQQKINVSTQLKAVTSCIMLSQGQCKMSNQNQLKQKQQNIMIRYRKNMHNAKQAFQKLIEVQKRTLKRLKEIEILQG